ncbi:sulfite exporter TauE/SafE family protein [Marinomonas transparens]|uniref:Probable membrane transporter protein n=1 Tax=Marinomonas transparens TaxID=2795388 RepID=A0A934JMV3_9GAMM|nr:sulfite exporter TauE/SafE family protein [Marinomonas transparens]MBJ7537343.1 sulfite exporter TauE/SafE family protein [Marinomonas transparens]
MENMVYLFPIVFIAGLVRGYSGFGFAVIAVVGMNLFLSPVESVPIVLGLDFICSLSLAKQAAKQADYRTFRILTLGSLVGIPIGLCLLHWIPENRLKLLICGLVMLLVLLLVRNHQASPDSLWRKLMFGTTSGIGTSSASIGGPMVLYYMLSSSLDVRAQRATMILFFIVSECIALLGLAMSHAATKATFFYLAWLLIPTLIAVKIGQYFFNQRPPQSFKIISLPLMMLVSIIGLIQALGAF